MTERIEQYEHDGLTFDVLDEGPVDGDPIVLLHGFPERASSWRKVAPILHAAGYRTLAPDQRGYSPGARPRSRREYGGHRMAEDAYALIQKLGGSAHVVGHDWGASVAWGVTGMHPEAVRTLTAVSVPHPNAFVKSWVRSLQGAKSWYMLAFQVPWLPERLVDSKPIQAWMGKGGMSAEDLARFQAEIVDDGALTTAMNWYRGMPFTNQKSGVGKRSRVPTTLVWSTGDIYIGRWAVDRCGDYVVDAPYKLVVLDGVSHWIPTQAPGALAEAILERVAG